MWVDQEAAPVSPGGGQTKGGGSRLQMPWDLGQTKGPVESPGGNVQTFLAGHIHKAWRYERIAAPGRTSEVSPDPASRWSSRGGAPHCLPPWEWVTTMSAFKSQDPLGRLSSSYSEKPFCIPIDLVSELQGKPVCRCPGGVPAGKWGRGSAAPSR